MVATKALLCLSAAVLASALKGEQGECIGPRFHKISYDMSDERDPETGLPGDFNVNIQAEPGSDNLCPPPNAGGTKKGVCVGINTNDCHQSRQALTIDDFLSCENCFVGLSTDINYELDVKLFKLKKVSVGFENMHLIGGLELLAHQAASKTVAEGSYPIIGEDLNYEINFMVANVIPINIKFKIPTSLTYKVTLSESVELRFGGDVDFNLGNHAIEWTHDNGWSTPSTSPSVNWTPVLQAKGKVAADIPIGLQSKLTVDFEKVLAYSVNFAPGLPLHAEAALDTNGQNEICLRSDADFKIDHEARLHFELFSKDHTIANWGPANLYTHHWDKIFDQCWDIPVEEDVVV